jgi:hypothetical protein
MLPIRNKEKILELLEKLMAVCYKNRVSDLSRCYQAVPVGNEKIPVAICCARELGRTTTETDE